MEKMEYDESSKDQFWSDFRDRLEPREIAIPAESVLVSLRDLPSLVQQIRDGLEVLFKSLPSNPAADHQGKNFFRMKQSDMVNGIISPDYYHFESQHEALNDLIQTFPLDKMAEKLFEVCKTGKITRSSINKTLLHPTVLEFIREACGYETKD